MNMKHLFMDVVLAAIVAGFMYAGLLAATQRNLLAVAAIALFMGLGIGLLLALIIIQIRR